MKKRIISMILVVVMLTAMAPAMAVTSFADDPKPVYYSIDYSASVLSSIIPSKVKDDSAIVAVATAEAYKYGATTDADKATVYDSIVADSAGSKTAPSWDNLGYSVATYSLENMYEQLSFGCPVLIVKKVGTVSTYAVVAGYTGSTSALSEDGFQIIDPCAAEASRKVTLNTWKGKDGIESIMVRKNGALVSALSGIHVLANHPASVNLKGKTFIPFGEIVSKNPIAEVSAGIYNLKTGAALFTHNFAPNSKFYNLLDFNDKILFAGYPEGNYCYVINAKDSTGASTSYGSFFSIVSAYPASIPAAPSLTVAYKANGGIGTIDNTSVTIGGGITLPSSGFTKNGVTLEGWTLRRSTDEKYFTSAGWFTEKEITANGLTKTVFPLGGTVYSSPAWLVGGGTDATYMFTAKWSNEEVFTDVKKGDYFYDAVYWAKEYDITKGTDDTHFSPSAACTRGQVVTFLYRAAGSPDVSGETCAFTDVKSSDYFYNAVLWAAKNNITTGTDATHFTPNGQCTRAQIVTFLYRAAKSPATGDTNPFVDVAKDAYYLKPVIWAKENSITTGTDATHFTPDAACTRGQVVTFLYRQYN